MIFQSYDIHTFFCILRSAGKNSMLTQYFCRFKAIYQAQNNNDRRRPYTHSAT